MDNFYFPIEARQPPTLHKILKLLCCLLEWIQNSSWHVTLNEGGKVDSEMSCVKTATTLAILIENNGVAPNS